MGVVRAGDGKSKIRVVIIDGENNHDWRSTTPIMKKALEDCGRFTVDVATSPQIPALPKPGKLKDEKDAKAAAKYKDDLAKYEAELPKFQEKLKAAQAELANWQIDFSKYGVVVSGLSRKSVGCRTPQENRLSCSPAICLQGSAGSAAQEAEPGSLAPAPNTRDRVLSSQAHLPAGGVCAA